jgi:hypothetical protein
VAGAAIFGQKKVQIDDPWAIGNSAGTAQSVLYGLKMV